MNKFFISLNLYEVDAPWEVILHNRQHELFGFAYHICIYIRFMCAHDSYGWYHINSKLGNDPLSGNKIAK